MTKVEGFKDVEISFKRDHDHDVEAAGEGDLGQGEDIRSYTRLDLEFVVRGEVGEAVEHQHSYLVRANQK